MSDILYSAAVQYCNLKNIAYNIILGRKGKAYELMLHFPPESFFHLAGLQHLSDITFPSKNKERILKEILFKKITIETLKKSEYFEEYYIEERLLYLNMIQTMLEDGSAVFLINPNEYSRYTTIKADYLFKYTYLNVHELYFFSIIERLSPRFENECKGCSFFKKHDTDFTKGTSKTTTLIIRKIINFRKEQELAIEIFRNPSYKEPE